VKRSHKVLATISIVLLGIALIVVTLIKSHIENLNDYRAALPSTSSLSLAVSSEVPSNVSTSPSSPLVTAVSSSSLPVALSSVIPTQEIPAIQPITPAAPTALHIHDLGIDIDAIVASMSYSDDLTPPACVDVPDDLDCPNKAFWVQDRLGMAPGYPAPKSTYIIGHAWSEQHRVFDQLSARILSDPENSSILKGAKVVVDQPNGSVTYEIDSVVRVRKNEISQADEIWERTGAKSNRLVLLMCALDRDYNFAVIGYTVATQPNS
jgi:hypothetical protein